MGVRPVKFFFEAGCTEVHLVSYLLLFCCKLLNNVRVIGVFIDPIIHFLVQSVVDVLLGLSVWYIITFIFSTVITNLFGRCI